MAGCAFSVTVSTSSGPSAISFESLNPRTSSASASVSAAIGSVSAKALAIPTYCDPCPGKIKAIDIEIWLPAQYHGSPSQPRSKGYYEYI